MDTYEISDRDDSTDDEDENEERQRSKHMPAWAQRHNLSEALKKQVNADPGTFSGVAFLSGRGALAQSPPDALVRL